MTYKNGLLITGLFAFAITTAMAVSSCGKGDESGSKPNIVDNGKKSGGGDKTGDGTKAPAGGGDYEEMDVTDGGTVSGTAAYSGDKKPGKLAVTKDEKICTHGGEDDGTIVVADGKLANVIVYLVDVKKGKKWGTEVPTLDNKECLFSPRVTFGRHKGQIATKNSDPVLHNTNLKLREGGKSLANVALPKQGQVIEKKLKKKGLVDVSCDVHPWMKGYVWVSPHPYVAISGADGAFSIDGVPPGDYKVKAWHEVFGEKDGNVTVAANGSATWDITYQ